LAQLLHSALIVSHYIALGLANHLWLGNSSQRTLTIHSPRALPSPLSRPWLGKPYGPPGSFHNTSRRTDSEHRFYFKVITKLCKYILTQCFKDMVQTTETVCATYVMFIVPLQLVYGEYTTQTTLSSLWTLNYCVDFVQVITAFYRLRQHLPANARDLIDWQHGQNQSRRRSGSMWSWLLVYGACIQQSHSHALAQGCILSSTA